MEKDWQKGEKRKVKMGLDLQPDGLTAGLAWHCQPGKNIHSLRKKRSAVYICFKKKQLTSSALLSK